MGEAHSKKNELEKQIEISEAETTTVKNDLKLALKRVEDLQTAINGELDSDSDSLNSDNDSDSSDDELSSHLLSASRRGSSLSRDSPAGSRTGKPLETMAEESETAGSDFEDSQHESQSTAIPTTQHISTVLDEESQA